jgi:DNA topoisomerase-1
MAAQNLLIIESPNKIETISHFLDKSFDIIATVGHIRDLSTKGGYGYDEKTLEPD